MKGVFWVNAAEVYDKMPGVFWRKIRYTKCDSYYKKQELYNKMQRLFQSKALAFNFVAVDQFAMRDLFFFSMKVFIDHILLARSSFLFAWIINSLGIYYDVTRQD